MPDELRSRRDRDLLLTGFPRTLTRLLARRVLASEPDARVRLLVAPDRVERVDDLREDLEAAPDRLETLEGDPTAIDLGLDGETYLELTEDVTDIYHVPGRIRTDASRPELIDHHRRSARHILDAAEEMEALERINHVSSAQISGDRTGVIMEGDFDEGQSFRNAWEEAKFRSERIVRRAPGDVPVTIYRPTLVVGHSDTGELAHLNGPYFLLSALVQMPDGLPLFVPGEGDYPLNLVPVDYVARAFYALSIRPRTSGRTFHLSDPDPLSARDLFERVARRAGNPPQSSQLPFAMTKWALKIPYLRRLMRSPRTFLEDIDKLKVYNGQQTRAALEGTVNCPPVSSYLDEVVTYLRSSPFDPQLEDSNLGRLLGFHG